MAAPQRPGFFGEYTGYAPRPGGGFDFTRANGGTVVVPPGPQAEDLKKNIDAAKGFIAPEFQPQPGPMAAPPTQPQQAAPGPARFQPTATVKGGGTLGVREGGDPNNPLDYVVREAPRAATKGGLALRTQSQQGGFEIDPERAKEIQDSQDDLMQAQLAHAQKLEQLSKERQAEFAAQRVQANREAAVLAHENTVKSEQVSALQARYEAAEKDFLETPERQKQAREGNTGRNIVESIALALGALGAGLARTPNFAQQTIESIHDREMRAEEAALRVKKEGAESLLGRLKDQMGSLDLAKQAWGAIKSRESAIKLEALAAQTQDEQQKSSILTMAAQQQQKYLEKREALNIGAQGETTKNFQMIQGSAGSRGGNRAPTIEELQGMANLRKTQADTSATLRPEAGSSKSLPTERTNILAEDSELVALGQKILSNPALKGDSEYFEPHGSVIKKLPFGDAMAHPKSNELEQDLQKWQNARIKAITGAGVSNQEAERIARAEVGNMSRNAIKRGVESGMKSAIVRTRSNLAPLTPEQREEQLKQMDPAAVEALKQGGKK